MKNGMFVGMGFDEIVAKLAEMGIEFESEHDEESVSYIFVGDYYGEHYSIEFDEKDVCDFSGWEDAEE